MRGRENIIMACLGLIPVAWLALLMAPFLGGGLVGILEGFPLALASPFSISMGCLKKQMHRCNCKRSII